MRRLLLAAVMTGGLTAMATHGASAAPVVGATVQFAAPPPHVVLADWYWRYHGWYWRHHYWHHRRWWNGRWHYWD